MANGSLSPGQLATVQGTQQLGTATAAAFARWQAAARAEGYSMHLASPAGGYRSTAVQQDMHDHPARYGITPGVVIAPVGASRHGQGKAVDIASCTGAFRLWCYSSAARHGFTLWSRSDPNHFEFGSALTPALPEEDQDMAVKYIATSNNATVTVGKDDIWVRPYPGAPLRRATAGQAGEWPGELVPKPGSWFDAAFAEDAAVYPYNALTHPWEQQGATPAHDPLTPADAGLVATEVIRQQKLPGN